MEDPALDFDSGLLEPAIGTSVVIVNVGDSEYTRDKCSNTQCNVHQRVLTEVHQTVLTEVHQSVQTEVDQMVQTEVDQRVQKFDTNHQRVQAEVHQRVQTEADQRVRKFDKNHQRVQAEVHQRVQTEADQRVHKFTKIESGAKARDLTEEKGQNEPGLQENYNTDQRVTEESEGEGNRARLDLDGATTPKFSSSQNSEEMDPKKSFLVTETKLNETVVQEESEGEGNRARFDLDGATTP